jgi:DNA-binding NtrC family response regulator
MSVMDSPAVTQTTIKPYRVLVCDDQPDVLEALRLLLKGQGWKAVTADSPASLLRAARGGGFDLILADLNYTRDTTSGKEGMDLLASLEAEGNTAPVVVMTAWGSVEGAVAAVRRGARDYVQKPWDNARLLQTLRTQVELGRALRVGQRLEHENRLLRREGMPEMIADAPAMRPVLDLLARVGPSDAHVLVTGEHGTGKELVARMIHESGPRRGGPFVAVNCGAIPTELMESELFGHKRGSFTGAVSDKKGLVQSAEGGTLFLDEVADLPLHMQVKLLRVVQEKTVRPVGESREERVDVRILSATHKNLADLVAQGQFREDLYYRINVIELRVPALRERGEDIGEIAEVILARLARRANTSSAGISPEAVASLQTYPFPGNVRELENVLERALTLSGGGMITPDHVRLRAATRPVAPGAGIASSQDPARDGSTALGSQLENLERDAIMKALEKTRYNKTAAAKLLGMSLRALRYRIKKLGIE